MWKIFFMLILHIWNFRLKRKYDAAEYLPVENSGNPVRRWQPQRYTDEDDGLPTLVIVLIFRIFLDFRWLLQNCCFLLEIFVFIIGIYASLIFLLWSRSCPWFNWLVLLKNLSRKIIKIPISIWIQYNSFIIIIISIHSVSLSVLSPFIWMQRVKVE